MLALLLLAIVVLCLSVVATGHHIRWWFLLVPASTLVGVFTVALTPRVDKRRDRS